MARSGKSSKSKPTEENREEAIPDAEVVDATSEADVEDGASDEPVEDDAPEVDASDDAVETDDSDISTDDLPDEDGFESAVADEIADGTAFVETAVEDTHLADRASVAPPAAPSAGKGGLLALFLGGIAAGLIGFGVARYVVPQSPPVISNSAEISELRESIADQEKNFAAIEARLDALDSGFENLGSPDAQFDEILGQIAGLGSRIDALDVGLADLADRPPAILSPDGSVAMEAQLKAFRDELDTVTAKARAEIEAAQERSAEIEAESARKAENAARRAALAQVQSALSSGEPYAAALVDLPSAPDALAGPAENGVPTLSALQTDFADVARSALAASMTVPETANIGDRMTAFLRRQTNARSLTPKEGDDTDAILSRAEAAVMSGDLDTALAEVSGLPDTAQDAVSGWAERAQIRSDAVAAVDALAMTIDAN